MGFFGNCPSKTRFCTNFDYLDHVVCAIGVLLGFDKWSSKRPYGTYKGSKAREPAITIFIHFMYRGFNCKYTKCGKEWNINRN